MLLENVLNSNEDDSNNSESDGSFSFRGSTGIMGQNYIWLVISQINILLSLVNDTLDLQLIEQGNFVPKPQRFSAV